MTMLESLIAITLGIISILGSLAFVISHLVKHYFAELKPNGGSSIKDQVNRLEQQHNKLDSKVDKIYEILLSQEKPAKATKSKS
jgi:iron-sulfur cluster repair protein YtfE (RIC family)